ATPSITPDGRFVVFSSYATNLVPGDTNGHGDVFIHDRDAMCFTNVCDPGVDGVLDCPCMNPQSGPARGCDNASYTGGASLSASGTTYLSMDSLVFTTSGENPSATSILLEGNALIAAGTEFGHAVRCAGGTLRRLFVKT